MLVELGFQFLELFEKQQSSVWVVMQKFDAYGGTAGVCIHKES